MRCEMCNCELNSSDECPSCNLYNAAVRAQQAAAKQIAEDFNPRADRAWLNEHGVFAYLDGVTVQPGTPAMAAPFVALTAVVRTVRFP